jgi:hypothetical protein
MESIPERIRRYHQEIEECQDTAVEQLLYPSKRVLE